jgi:ATP-dependent DNA helicase RecQ
LDYFGDPHRPPRCGLCDRCQLEPGRVLSGEPLNDALKALSAVARMRGRYGRGRVTEVLLGSRSKAVLEAGLEQLSTYGLLGSWSKDEVMQLLDSLARAGLVKTTLAEYPKLELTVRGAEVLKSRGPIELDLRTRRWSDRREGGIEEERRAIRESDLFLRLRAWRSEVAKRTARAPFMVAHDAHLEALALLRPVTEDELAAVPGIGPAKLAAYGEAILQLIRRYVEERAGLRPAEESLGG